MRKVEGLYQSKVASSLAAIQRPGHWADNCEMVYFSEKSPPSESSFEAGLGGYYISIDILHTINMQVNLNTKRDIENEYCIGVCMYVCMHL